MWELWLWLTFLDEACLTTLGYILAWGLTLIDMLAFVSCGKTRERSGWRIGVYFTTFPDSESYCVSRTRVDCDFIRASQERWLQSYMPLEAKSFNNQTQTQQEEEGAIGESIWWVFKKILILHIRFSTAVILSHTNVQYILYVLHITHTVNVCILIDAWSTS